MTTVSQPRLHPAARPLGRARSAFLATLLALGAAPALASNVATTASTDAAIPAAVLAPVAIATPDSGPPASAADASAPARVKTVLQRAFSLLGTPYRWGGSSPEAGFDCSGLVGYVFRTIGIDLPRVSRAMAHEGTPVASRAALAEGDLVFFGRNGGSVDHVGIYIGDGKFVHAPRTGRDVTVSSLSTGYWSQKYLQARRLAVGS